MTPRARATMLVAGLFVLAGCGSTAIDSQPAASQQSQSGGTSTSMAPGMHMAPGESMSDMAGPGGSGPGKPSADSRLVCGPEIRRNIGHLLHLNPAPPGHAIWRDHVYTCTYPLPAGPLVLAVTEATDVPAAHRAFRDMRRALQPTQPLTGLAGLGLPAFETRTGTAVFLKDNMVLRVDATRLMLSGGAKSASRSDVAYEVATDVMGCWAES
ncbi:MAG: hypothetical protein QOK15_2330 [Nocardioidaceae bacterium]|nr:hypothetical protein [Nocardioidaceae bacterium]